jgi:oligopeptide/dipeptide ABC transporter ATP-binding protein
MFDRRATRASEHLRVEHLEVTFGRGTRRVVRDVSFDVPPGEAFGLAGESGSGKSMTLRSILGLLPPGAKATGSIHYGDRSLLELAPREYQRLRGSTVGMVFQDPMTALNPVLRVRDSIAQVVQAHDRADGGSARRRAVELMERVGIRDAARRSLAYPHQFSGGMRQRVVIAMALAARPSLLLADEPTTALDVVVQGEILRTLDRLRREDGMTLLLVSHDFGVIAGLCNRVGVMYAGELVELGPTERVLFEPSHPYTVGLINSLPEAGWGRGARLRPIPGSQPEAGEAIVGSAFAPRCPLATDECRAAAIPLAPAGPDHLSRCIHVDRIGELRTAGSPEGVGWGEMVAGHG